jgi:hypothetical protein
MQSRRNLVLLSAGFFVYALAALAQDSPSLGDVARQARLQKQQKDTSIAQPAKDGQSSGGATPVPANAAPGATTQGADAANNSPAKDAPSAKPVKRVITNDEIPEHIGPTSTNPGRVDPVGVSSPQPNHSEEKLPAEQWKSQIVALKNNMAALQQSIGSLSASIQYAGANCVANCEQWNERQKQKQDQVETMKGQLEQQQKMLEDLQDRARKQGYGSSVYDP